MQHLPLKDLSVFLRPTTMVVLAEKNSVFTFERPFRLFENYHGAVLRPTFV